MDIHHKQPTTWDEYDGTHRGSVDSQGSRVHWDELERRPSGESVTSTGGEWGDALRRRR